MKTILFLLISVGSFAQGGVYLTYDDYLNQRLTHKEAKVNTNDFLGLSYITVKDGETKIKLLKVEIYGIAANDCSLIKFENNERYYLAETGKMWIFYKWINVPEGKRHRKEKQYYFSVSGDTPLMPLTVTNLKKAFSNNIKFQDLVDVHFQTTSATHYDIAKQQFKANYLLAKSEQ
jgi:hypothetical protein